ncbi:MAG: GNAT family N-acetyltransferase [Candidatus Methanomethylophilaceae archaeon]
MIRKLKLGDDLLSVADMMYDAHFSYHYLLGEKERAIPVLARLITLEHTFCSYRNIWVHCNEDDSIDGVFVGYLPRKIDVKARKAESRTVLSFMEFYGYEKRMKRYSKLIMHEPGGSYIKLLYILKESRGKGIASDFMKVFCDFSKENGCEAVYIDVSVKNDILLKLVRDRGFKEQSLTEVNFQNIMLYRMMKRIDISDDESKSKNQRSLDDSRFCKK